MLVLSPRHLGLGTESLTLTARGNNGSFGAMKLNEWLEQQAMPKWMFAARLEIHPSALSHILSGSRKPNLKIALKIEALTKGKVKVKQWADPTP